MKRERENRAALEKNVTATRHIASILAKKLAGPLDNLAKALDDQVIKSLDPSLTKSACELRNSASDEQAKINAFLEDPTFNYDPDANKEASACCVGLAHIVFRFCGGQTTWMLKRASKIRCSITASSCSINIE